MGFLEDTTILGPLLKKDDPKRTIVDPLASNKTTAADYLTSLLSNQNLPKQGVAGMTEMERYGQDYLKNYATSSLPAGMNASYNYYNSILNQPTDITQLPEFQAILKSIGAETSKEVNRSNRRTQLSGLGSSTSQGSAAGKEIALGGQRMLAQLGPYAQEARGRQMNAAQMLAEISRLQEQLQQGRLGAISTYGALPRQLTQAELGAGYNQQMMPYTTMAPLAQGLIGNGVDYTITQDPSMMEQLAPLFGAAVQGAGAYAASDRRVKENISDFGPATQKIKKIHAKVYNYKGTDPNDRRVGVIAQNVESVMPEAVKDIGGVKHVDYAAISALATQAVNELIDEVLKMKKVA